MRLDDQIVDAFSVVSLLIAISAAYLAGIWPVVNTLLHEPGAAVKADRRKQQIRCTTYAAATLALTIVNGLIAALLIPLTVSVVRTICLHGTFHTVRAGLLLAELLVVSGTIVSAVLAVRLNGQRRQLKVG